MKAAPVMLHAFDLDKSANTDWFASLLSPEEQARATRFVDDQVRHRFITCRGQVREILATHIGERPAKISIEADEEGKPYLPNHRAVHFNISHTGASAVLAIASTPIGVDIEGVRPLQENVAERFFHSGEIAELAQWTGDEYWAGFFRVWTKKEAFLKALGKGLRLPLDKFQTPAAAGAYHRLIACTFDPDACSRYCLADFTLEGAQGSLCMETPESAFSFTLSISPPAAVSG